MRLFVLSACAAALWLQLVEVNPARAFGGRCILGRCFRRPIPSNQTRAQTSPAARASAAPTLGRPAQIRLIPPIPQPPAATVAKARKALEAYCEENDCQLLVAKNQLDITAPEGKYFRTTDEFREKYHYASDVRGFGIASDKIDGHDWLELYWHLQQYELVDGELAPVPRDFLMPASRLDSDDTQPEGTDDDRQSERERAED